MTKPKWYHYLLAAGSQDPDNPTARMYSPSEEARAYAEGDDKKIGQMHNDQLAYEKAVAPAKAVTAVAGSTLPIWGPYALHASKVLMNPMTAKTGLGFILGTAADLIGAAEGVKDLYNVHRKWSAGKFHHSDIPRAVIDFASTVPALSGTKKVLNTAIPFYKQLPKRVAEIGVRIGDTAYDPKALVTQYGSREAFKYMFLPGFEESAYKLPFKYSGQSQFFPGKYTIFTKDINPITTGGVEFKAPGRMAHYGDMIDVGFGKTNFLRALSEDGSTYIDFPVSKTPITEEFVEYINNNYDGRKILYIDFGNVNPGNLNVRMDPPAHYTSSYHSDKNMGKIISKYGELPTVTYTDPKTGQSFPLVDPGGHRYTLEWFPNSYKGLYHGEDIFKFNPNDYMKKHHSNNQQAISNEDSKFNVRKLISKIVTQPAIKFLDDNFTPIVTKWTEPVDIKYAHFE